jgi:hypothetical protein
MATFGGSNIVTDGLVLWLDAANRKSYPGSGTSWLDLSGNNNTGTLTNGPTFSSASNGSIVFDGVDDYVLNPTVNYNNYSNNFTANVWIKANIVTGSRGIAGWGHSGVAPYYTWALALFDGKFTTQIYNGTNYYVSSSIVEANVWYNAAFVVYQSGLMELYINSTKFSALGSSNLIRSRTDQYDRTIIGANPNISQPTLNGNIALTQIYNRALSAQEVRQNYDALKSRYLNIY